jgi:hypothetical protein
MRAETIRPVQSLRNRILVIRGQRVMLDLDVAEVYGVPTKRLSEQVKRNRDRFPEDFMFQLRIEEKTEVVAICDHLQKLKFSPQLPYAFTSSRDLAQKLAALERKYDAQFKEVFAAIREIMTPLVPKRRIGFLPAPTKARNGERELPPGIVARRASAG